MRYHFHYHMNQHCQHLEKKVLIFFCLFRIIRHLFRKLQKQNEKIMLFLDDLEVLYVDEYSSSERIRRARTELLCQVDHADNVIIVTGTNQPWTIHHVILKRLGQIK